MKVAWARVMGMERVWGNQDQNTCSLMLPQWGGGVILRKNSGGAGVCGKLRVLLGHV